MNQERPAYMRRPEVWSEIQSVFDEYLKHCPWDAMRRSKYAFLCYLGAHYREAHAQFQAVGDDLTSWPIMPNVPLQTRQRMRDETARIVVAEPGGAKPVGGAAPAGPRP